MKIRLVQLIGGLAIGVAMSGFSAATTITFTGHTANSDVTDKDDGAYGSHVGEETLDFITSDGTGATPNIALVWETATGPNADVWEFHDSATFSLLDPGTTGDRPRPTGVAQLDVNIQNGIPPADPTITFVPDLGYAVTIHSFNIGHATDLAPHEGKNSWKITLSRLSDKKVVWSHTTEVLEAGDFESVKVGFKGEPGEQYRLRFDRGLVNHPRGGIDNLSFSQSERQPLTEKQLAAARKTLQERIEELKKGLVKANQAKERAEKALDTVTKLHDDTAEDQEGAAEARLEATRERARLAEQKVADLTRQITTARGEYAELLEEKPTEEKPTGEGAERVTEEKQSVEKQSESND